MTLEKIKDLIYPKNETDWVEVLKELVIIKFGENKLIEFDFVYLYHCGDCSEYVWGVAVVNNKLFAIIDDREGNCEFGIAYFGEGISEKKGVGLTENAIKSICKLIFEEKLGRVYKTPIAFDFSEMKGSRDWFEDYFLKGIKRNQEMFDSFINGNSCGYFNIY